MYKDIVFGIVVIVMCWVSNLHRVEFLKELRETRENYTRTLNGITKDITDIKYDVNQIKEN